MRARATTHAVRFGPFEISSDSGELHKNGARIRISGQVIQVLLILVENPGRVVSREELQQKLWPGASFGDFEHGLNAAVNRLREVLGDSVSDPKYIETIPRRGYRFIGQLESQHDEQTSVIQIGCKAEKIVARPGLRRKWKLLFLAGALLSAGAVTYFLLRHPMKPLEGLRIVPLTTYPGLEALPSFSPDGNEIAFTWFRQDATSTAMTADLYTKQIGNEQVVRLTSHEAQFLTSAWSPDGRNIAFGMASKDGNGIYLIPARGGREQRLAQVTPYGWQWLLVSWSPDNTWLAFASDADKSATAPRYRIHLLNIETREEHVLPEPAPECAMTIEPAISPDGKSLASVCVLTLGTNRLYVQQIDGNRPRALAQIDTSFVLAGLAWSADGHSIVYSTYGTTGRLWRVPVAGGTPQQISDAHGTDSPAVARVGNKLAYTQTNYHYDIWSVALGRGMPAATPSRLISSTWDQANPNISPDGKLIVFDSSRSGNYEIWVSDRDGGKPLQLSSFGGPQTGGPRWSPNGEQIIFNSKASGRMETYVLNINGGPAQRLPTGTQNALWPSWSGDGKWIYFATEQPTGIWKVPSAGGVAIRLTSDGAYPQESSDGARVFYVVGGAKGELWSVSVNGGGQHREAGAPDLLNPYSWTPDPKGIYFIDGPHTQLSIQYFRFSTRRTEKIVDLHGMAFVCCGIAIAHDNDTLLFSGLDRLESDIMLIENFR